MATDIYFVWAWFIVSPTGAVVPHVHFEDKADCVTVAEDISKVNGLRGGHFTCLKLPVSPAEDRHK